MQIADISAAKLAASKGPPYVLVLAVINYIPVNPIPSYDTLYKRQKQATQKDSDS